MKKMLGVLILATLPVACGTTNPNAPALPAAEAAVEASSLAASALARSAPACVPVTRAVVTERDHGEKVSYLEVSPMGSDGSDTTVAFCGRPTWSVKPQGRGVRLTTGLKPDNAVLEAPRGTYVVTAAYPGPFQEVSASVNVSFR